MFSEPFVRIQMGSLFFKIFDLLPNQYAIYLAYSKFSVQKSSLLSVTSDFYTHIWLLI